MLKNLTGDLEYYLDGVMINYLRADVISFMTSFQAAYLKYNRLK